jgi:PAS domain S-box-containing protein
VAVSYFVAGKFGRFFVPPHSTVSAFWAPTGITLAAFLLKGYRIWPAIFLGSLAFHATEMSSAVASLGIAVGNTLEGLLGAYLVNTFAGGVQAFYRPRNVLRFVILGGFAATAVSATIGVSLFCWQGLAGWSSFWPRWETWWLGDAQGALAVAPFLVLLLGQRHHPLSPRELFEVAVLLVGLNVACLFKFGPLSLWWGLEGSPALLCAPFLAWAALRFCPLEAAGTVLIQTGFAAWGTMHGHGVFAGKPTAPLLLASYVAISATLTLVVASATAQRRRDQEKLIGFQSLLQASIAEKTRELRATVESLHEEVVERIASQLALEESNRRFLLLAENIPDVFWLLDAVEERTLYVSPAYETIWGRTTQSLYADPHSWLDAVHPEDHERALVFFDRESREKKFEAKYRIVRPDGTHRWIHDRGFVIRGASGQIVCLAGLASDITERKRQELEFLAGDNEKKGEA